MSLISGSVWSLTTGGFVQSTEYEGSPPASPAVPLYVVEQRDERVNRRVRVPWGTGTQCLRVVHSPKQKWDDYIASGWIYDLGTVMPAEWALHTLSSKPLAPLLQSVERAEQPQGGGDRVILNYLELDGEGVIANGYVELSNSWLPREGAEADDLVIYGAALAHDSSGIPTIGKTETDGSATAITDYVCYRVDLDEHAQHGRVMVTSYYRKLLAGGYYDRNP